MSSLTTNEQLSVLITRPERAAQRLATAVSTMGLKPIIAPMVEIRPLQNNQSATSATLKHAHIMIFISPAAVEFARNYLQDIDLKRKLLFAVGSSTGAKMRELLPEGMSLDIRQPRNTFNSEALLEMAELGRPQVAARNVLIVRGHGGRELLADKLTERGAKITYLEVYERVPSEESLRGILAESHVSVPSIGVVTSVEGLRLLAGKISAEKLTRLLEMPILASGARIAAKVPDFGFTNPPLITDNPTQDCILAGLKCWLMEKL